MRVTLIHNPGAGDGDHGAGGIARCIAAAGHEVRAVGADEPGWEGRLEDVADLVAVAGGDGTVGDVVARLGGRGLPVAIIPLGSANNLARTLGVAGAEVDPADWERAPRRRLDVARATAGGAPVPIVESAGGGLFAEVLARAEEDPGDPSGEDSLRQGRHLLSRVLRGAEAMPWDVVIDGRDHSGRYLAVEAMNIREIGPRVPLAPGADPGDGLLDVVLAGPEHRDLLGRIAGAPPQAAAALATGLPVWRGRRVTLRAPAGAGWHVDDRPLDADGPLSLSAAEAAVDVVVRQAA